MAFDLSEYITVAERIAMAMAKWPDASFQNIGTKLINVDGHFYVEATVALYRDPNDIRPAIATAWEAIPGATPYTRDSEMMNAETSAMGRAVIAAGIQSKKIASVEEIQARQLAPFKPVVVSDEPPQIDPWSGEPVVTENVRNAPADGTPVCTHGIMKYWRSSKTGKVLYFCPLDKDDPQVCKAVEG